MEYDLEGIVGDASELRGACVGIERRLRGLKGRIAAGLKQGIDMPFVRLDEMARQIDFAIANIEDAQHRISKIIDYSDRW